MDDASFATLKDEVRAYVQGPAARHALRIEEQGVCGRDIWDELRSRGYLRLAAPEVYGGHGLSLGRYLQLLELFSQMHGSMRMIVHVVNGIWRPTDRLASPAQRERYVKPLVRGEHMITFTLTEPMAGTGTDIRTSARREGDHYVLNGEKWLITFADVADYFLLFCRLEGTSGAEGTLALLVARDAPGLVVEQMPPTMGLTGTGHGHLYLRECPVPVSARLGAEGDGLDVAFHGFLDPSRICIGMTCVGLAERALTLAVRRAKERVTFGKPLVKRQTIQMMIAEMATDIEAARQLALHAARVFESGADASAAASMAKLFGSQMLQRVTDQALQIHGGIGYFHGSEIERIYRDARAQRFEEGTAEIQKTVIARERVTRA